MKIKVKKKALAKVVDYRHLDLTRLKETKKTLVNVADNMTGKIRYMSGEELFKTYFAKEENRQIAYEMMARAFNCKRCADDRKQRRRKGTP